MSFEMKVIGGGNVKVLGNSKLKVVVNSESVSIDSDANNYIAAVEAADGQSLEQGIKSAYNNFIVGCKSDGIWSAIKASCIMAGARTLNGALVPLIGNAPTNVGNGFIQTDYNRKTGLKGNGTSKYLNTNCNSNITSQNNYHQTVYATEANTLAQRGYIGHVSGNDYSNIFVDVVSGLEYFRNRSADEYYKSTNNLGFFGTSRNSGSSFIARSRNESNVKSPFPASSIGTSVDSYVFHINGVGQPTNARLFWYSIGEDINLTSLQGRVSTLITDIASAI